MWTPLMRGCVCAIVHCFTVVTVTLLSLSTMETGNGQDTLHINDGGSHWPADILVGCLMFLLAAWYRPRPPLWSTASPFRPTAKMWSSICDRQLLSLCLKLYQQLVSRDSVRFHSTLMTDGEDIPPNPSRILDDIEIDGKLLDKCVAARRATPRKLAL